MRATTVLVTLIFATTTEIFSQVPTGEKIVDDTSKHQQPEYPGGMKALYDFIQQNTCYPDIVIQQKIQGKVWVSFIIDTVGKVTHPSVISGLCPKLDSMAISVFNNMPLWQPGYSNGKPVKVKYTIPILFKIHEIRNEVISSPISCSEKENKKSTATEKDKKKKKRK